jgi:glycosyltransferase involved in cell wall biosynthesis
MKIQAFMPVLNESDVLPYTLQHLREQGVSVHVIDGWSTDTSYDWALVAPGVTVEYFPPDQPSRIQVCADILHRIEELAAHSDADWILYTDADEWRRSSRDGETLLQGVERLDAEGFNAIDFRVFAFFCTDAGWHGDPEKYFRYYNETDCICRLPNRKLWKNTGQPVKLADGGHRVTFNGCRLSPEKFVMKHYPFRTPDQARRKLETRIERRCHEEHKRGWGTHYDEKFPEGFLWRPEDLHEWPDTGTARP